MPTDVASWGPDSGPPSAIRRYSSQVPRARLGGSGVEWGVAQRTFLLRRASFFSIESTPAMRQSWVNSARARPFLGGDCTVGVCRNTNLPLPEFRRSGVWRGVFPLRRGPGLRCPLAERAPIRSSTFTARRVVASRETGGEFAQNSDCRPDPRDLWWELKREPIEALAR